MTERLTLAQAQAVIDANLSVAGLVCVDTAAAGAEARCVERLWYSEARTIEQRKAILAIADALMAYQAHLDHEAGRTFELAAVRRAAQLGIGADDSMDGEAFLRFDEALAKGYHHAEPSTPVVQIGDVWRIGAMVASDVEVRCVHAETGNLTVSAVHGKDRAHKVVSTAKFTSNRRLVERDGEKV